MEAIDASLPRKDGVAIFDQLLLQVTLAVDSASSGTEFENKGFLDRLDVVFACLLRRRGDDRLRQRLPVAWRSLVETRSRPASQSVTLAGMTAHIDRDLPIAVVSTCGQFGLAPDDDSAIHRNSNGSTGCCPPSSRRSPAGSTPA